MTILEQAAKEWLDAELDVRRLEKLVEPLEQRFCQRLNEIDALEAAGGKRSPEELKADRQLMGDLSDAVNERSDAKKREAEYLERLKQAARDVGPA